MTKLNQKIKKVSLHLMCVSFVFVLLIFLTSCNIFNSNDDDSIVNNAFELKPDAVCTNSSSDEWTHLGLNEESVRSILIHPENPQVIFAGTSFDYSAQRDGKIFRSMDCGENWEKVYEGGSFRGLLLHPKNPYTLFAWDHRQSGGLLRSTDGGDTWKLHSEGMSTDGTNRVSEVLIHPDNTDIMYASTSGFWSGAVYKSLNGGRSWNSISSNHLPILGSGATAMFIHPNQPGLLLHSADGNTYISRTENGGQTWEDVFYAEGHVNAYALNPINPNQILAIASRRGLLISDDRGKDWRVEAISDTIDLYYDVKYIDNHLYIATARGVLRTQDLKNYIQVGSQELGDTSDGDTIYFPRNVRAVVSDTHKSNLYIGHSLMLFNDEKFGGVYVRKLEN